MSTRAVGSHCVHKTFPMRTNILSFLVSERSLWNGRCRAVFCRCNDFWNSSVVLTSITVLCNV